ncbi:ATP synthase subunit I [Hydrogenophaga sp. 5NK40-0174]|uniref:ATP synthase subunit I n=1 Tax=Hydrogenophaga sp. 5NK40-0174 TaxID=3127649 RepID=UPI003103DCAA
MTTSPGPAPDKWEDGEQDSDFKPLTREQAQQWRARQPETSIWKLVMMQSATGLITAALAWMLVQPASVAWSVIYGSAAVALPSAVMAWGLTSSATARLWRSAANAAFAGLLLWEGIKVLLAVAMLWSAPLVVPDLNWLGLLVGLVLTLKVHWLGLWLQTRSPLKR